jgi:uncharacterized delta-60 repeat protein
MLLFIVLNTQPVPAAAPVKDASSNELVVSMLYQGDWRPVGALAFDKTPSEGILDFSGLSPKERWVFLRIQHSGATAAQLDAALIDGIAPKRLYNAAGSASLALRKLAQKDYDLVDIHNQTLYLVYEVPTGNPTTLALTARIDPEVLSQTPYQFPLENLYQVMTPDSAFYSYSWDSQPGSLTLDGDLEGESLGKPFVSEFVTPGSGHPEGNVYWWVFNDAQNLYAVLDFVPDNTMDGDKDYAKVYLNTPSGLRSFKVSVPEQTWGKPGFVYTPRAVYQHKVYEFAIPLSELGLFSLDYGTPLSLAFAAYGTVSPPNPNTYPGPLDYTFSGDGWLTTDFGSSDSAHAVAIQKDGKIVVAGASNSYFAVARYNPDGTLDNTFSGDGKLTTDFSSGSTDNGYAVVLQQDGKIVVAGISGNNFAVARYETDGDLDPTFSVDGLQTTDLGSTDHAFAVAIQENSMIVVAGSRGDDFAVARYETDGNLDTYFGVGGISVTDFSGGTDAGYAVALQNDGKIVVAGASGSDFGLVRYNLDGILDNTFDFDGKLTLDFGPQDEANSVVILDNHKIVVAGYSGWDFALARFNHDGSPDPTFSEDGRLTTDFGSQDFAYGLVIQRNLKTILAGCSQDFIAVARYLHDGDLDPTFGTLGMANTFYGGGPEGFTGTGYDAALQNDGKIVVVGFRMSDFLVVRYAPPEIYLPLVRR